MNQHKVTKFTIITRKLLGALSLAAAITAATPLMATHAQEDRPGNDMAHQERNPSQHPELFSGISRDTQKVQVTDTLPVRRNVRRNRAKVEDTKAIFVLNSPRDEAGAKTTDDAIGTNAPHQERNPSAHPELWDRNAKR